MDESQFTRSLLRAFRIAWRQRSRARAKFRSCPAVVHRLEDRLLMSFSPTSSNPEFNAGGAVSAVDPSTGDIYVATAYNTSGSNNDFAVTRFTASGAVDTNWGGNYVDNKSVTGTYIIPSFSGSSDNSQDIPKSIAMTSDGTNTTVTVAGTSSAIGWAVVMLNTAYDSGISAYGSVDWKETAAFQTGDANAVTYDSSDSDVIVAGSNGGQNMVVAKLGQKYGTLDTNFGDADPNNPSQNTGIKTIANDNNSNDTAAATAVIELHDSGALDDVMLAGYTDYYTPDGHPVSDFTLVRLSDKGAYDTTFGNYDNIHATTRTNFASCNPNACTTVSSDAAYSLAEWNSPDYSRRLLRPRPPCGLTTFA